MAFAGMKIEFGEEDRALIASLTSALEGFGQELKRYNDASEKIEYAVEEKQ